MKSTVERESHKKRSNVHPEAVIQEVTGDVVARNMRDGHALVREQPINPSPERGTQNVLAIFCYEDAASPMGQYIAKTVPALAAQGTDVHVFCRGGYKLSGPFVKVYAVGNSREENLIARVQDFSQRAVAAFRTGALPESAALLCFEWSAVPVLGVLNHKRTRRALVSFSSFERQRSDMKSDLSRQIEEIEYYGLKETDVVLIEETAVADAAKKIVPECAPRIVAMHKDLAPQASDPGEIKRKYHVGPIDPMILFVGAMDDRHGADLLMKAIPPILKNHPQSRFVFVGDGPLQWPLRVHARYLLLEHAVRMAGHLEGAPVLELMQAADVVCVPSREPAGEWQIATALSFGRPVVTTHPAGSKTIRHEENGVLVYPNEGSIVWGIERLLFDEGLRKKIGQAAQTRSNPDDGLWKESARQLGGLIAKK